MPAPTFVVSPPAPTTDTGATCGTKIRLRNVSVATECEPDDCGIFSIRRLVAASTTPSTAFCWLALGHGVPGVAAQQDVVVGSDRGAVWSAGLERDHPGVSGRVEEALHCLRLCRIGHK